MKQKNEFWQCVRGICILAVIMIHCPSGAVYEIGSSEFTTWLLLRQFINFPVAIFIFLAGYFINPGKCTDDTWAYIKKRGQRLLIPYLFWSVFYSAVSVILNVRNGENIDWLKLIYQICIGKASTPLYYIVVLFQLTLITPYLVRLVCKGKKWSRILWFITPVYLILVYVYNFITGTMPLFYETLFPAWFIFYYLGVHMKIHHELWQDWVKRLAKWYWFFAALILSIFESVLLIIFGCSSGFASSQIKFGSFLYTFTIIMFLCQIYEKKWYSSERKMKRMLRIVGDYSYGIYYIHCFILMFVEKVLNRFWVNEIWIIYFICTWILTMTISFGVICFVNKSVIKSERILKWIGFK